MGSLTRHLQDRFALACPPGWSCAREVSLAQSATRPLLGFDPRADLMLERRDGTRRIWIEFEISRADPVANHAKFATTRFFDPGSPAEAFVSMTSRHVAAGRAALAAGTAMMMRALGFPAFQVELFPALDAASIQAFNRSPVDALMREPALDVRAELDRVLQVTDALVIEGWHRIHKADNPYTVGVNVREWNRQIRDEGLRARWGRRAVRYFAFDPASGLYAPSKFCAFIPAPAAHPLEQPFTRVSEPPGAMRLAHYFELGEQDPRFDGHVARVHLQKRLGYRVIELAADAQTAATFARWHRSVADIVTLQGATRILVPSAGSYQPKR